MNRTLVTSVPWPEANQRLVVAELERLKGRLGAEGDATALQVAVVAARQAMPSPAAIDHLSACCGLSRFERDVLLLCAGVEMDAGLAALCKDATNPGSGPPGATFGLTLATLEDPHWSALAPTGPLRRWRLVELEDSGGLVCARLRIDERILHYLAGINGLDRRLTSLLRPVSPPAVMAESHRTLCTRIYRILARAKAPGAPLVWLLGDDAQGQADIAATVAARLGFQLHTVQAQDLPAAAAEIEALATLWQRESLLLRSLLLVRCGVEPLPPAVARFLERLDGPVFVSARQPQPVERFAVRFSVDKPAQTEQLALWQQALGAGATRLNGTLEGIAGQFRLSARTIQAEGRSLAPELAEAAHPDRVMWSACRSLAGARLDELAQRVETTACWDDLVLPEAQKATLRQVSTHLRHRHTVLLDWGFARQSSRGLGICALFTGESGTGKTMAAEVLAGELQLDLFRIDLSAVVSKYIGETEKNLRRVFDAAEDSGAILLFDEADALFGKRSEVKDSHDRYANIEVSYLLQRMEAYRGLAILTSNHKAALDSAFQRRLRFVVHFPFPDAVQREAIWRGAFPPAMPRGQIDYAKLARLGVTGGSIRNIALHAAFRAAECAEQVSMQHLLQAARHEASKRESPLSDIETRGWV